MIYYIICRRKIIHISNKCLTNKHAPHAVSVCALMTTQGLYWPCPNISILYILLFNNDSSICAVHSLTHGDYKISLTLTLSPLYCMWWHNGPQVYSSIGARGWASCFMAIPFFRTRGGDPQVDFPSEPQREVLQRRYIIFFFLYHIYIPPRRHLLTHTHRCISTESESFWKK